MIDRRRANMEMQIIAQEYILNRAEIYSSDLLLVQFSVEENQKKGDMDYEDIREVIVIVFMKNSPKVFQRFDSEHYIHRFDRWVADSGMEYEPLRKVIYVQLDKSFEQLKAGKDAEEDKELQSVLAAMADINAPEVIAMAEEFDILRDILKDVSDYSKNREVQTMLLAEKYAIADYNAVRSEDRAESRAEGRAETVDTIMKNTGRDLTYACNLIGMPIEEYHEIKARIEKRSM